MLKIWSLRDNEQQKGTRKSKVSPAALRIQKDLNDLDMSQYPTMKLIFDEVSDPKTPGEVQSPGRASPATTPGSPRSSDRSGSGSAKEAAGFLYNGSMTARSGSSNEGGAPAPGTHGTNTTPMETMTKEEEKRKLHFRLQIRPDDGHYVGGLFKFKFDIPEGYPHEAPKVKCVQKIYHPNIDLQGNICLNILREDWKPVLNLNSILVGLQYLFLEPNPDDPLNKAAAEVQKRDRNLFIEYVKKSMQGRSIGDGEQYDDVRDIQ